MKLRNFLKLIGLASLCPVEAPASKVMFDPTHTVKDSRIEVREETVEIHWYLTTNIMLRSMNDGQVMYYTNARGDFAALIADVYVMKPNLIECKYVKIESAPFSLADQKISLLDRASAFLKEVNQQVEAHPEKLEGMCSGRRSFIYLEA